MLNGTTPSAFAIVGTAVFRIVVSTDSMKNATATSHGSKRLMDGEGKGVEVVSDTAPGLEDVKLM